MPALEMMGLISWILMGLFAGALARYFSRGEGALGCLPTILVGIAGAVIGGFLATVLGFGGFKGFDVYSLVVATLGAIVLLLILRLVRPRG